MSVVNLSEFVIENNLTKVIVIDLIYFSFTTIQTVRYLGFTLPRKMRFSMDVQHIRINKISLLSRLSHFVIMLVLVFSVVS